MGDGEEKEPPMKILFGNKSDLNHMAKVDRESHNTFAKQKNMTAYIGSAKSGDNINQLFYKAAADLSGVKVT